MPFDGTTRTSIADKMRAILDRGWCKRHLRDNDGAHCLMGALLEAREEFRPGVPSFLYDFLTYNATPDVVALSEAVAKVSQHHKRLHGSNHWSRIATFNNDPATSYDDIVRVLDEFAARTATKELQNAI
jgi:hypothetical protein